MKKCKRICKKILIYTLCMIMATNNSITTWADTAENDLIGSVSDGQSVLIEDLAEEKCEECGEYSCVCVQESSETEESTESSEVPESSEAEESTESSEAAESSETEESTESSEAAESSETEESIESSEAAESSETEESTESTESTEIEEKSESAESTESTESTETEESSETTEIVESAEETNAALENLMQILPAGAEVPENCTEVYTYVDINGNFEVTVCAPEGALPEGAVLAAEVLAEDSEAYAAAEEAISAQQEYDGMVALDIRFEKDGEEVEPSEAVYVFINIREMLPETADPESVAVQHHAETDKKILGLIPTGNTEVEVSVVADNTAETGIVETVESTTAEAVDVVAAFAVDGFSYFTVTWTEYNKTLNIQCVDMDGNLLTDDSEPINIYDFTEEDDNTNDIALEKCVYDILESLNKTNLKYSSAYVLVNNNQVAVTNISYDETDGWKYKDATGNYQNWAVADDDTPVVYLVLESSAISMVFNDITLDATVKVFNYDSTVNTTTAKPVSNTNNTMTYIFNASSGEPYVDSGSTHTSNYGTKTHLMHTNDRVTGTTNFRYGYSLVEGYPEVVSPVLGSKPVSYGNLSYLFDESVTTLTHNNGSILKGTMTDGGGLFQLIDGYYVYDSS